MTAVDLTLFWFLLSLLYILTGIIVRVLYREELPIHVSLALITFGSAIFVSVNRRVIVSHGYDLAEVTSLVLLFFGWALAVLGVRIVAIEHRKWVQDAT